MQLLVFTVQPSSKVLRERLGWTEGIAVILLPETLFHKLIYDVWANLGKALRKLDLIGKEKFWDFTIAYCPF